MHTCKSAPEIVKVCAATSKLPHYWLWESWSQTQPTSKFWHSKLNSWQWKELSHAGEITNSHFAETWKVNVCEEMPQQSQAQQKVPEGWCSWGLRRTLGVFEQGDSGALEVSVVYALSQLSLAPGEGWKGGAASPVLEVTPLHMLELRTVLQDGALSNKGDWINTSRV